MSKSRNTENQQALEAAGWELVELEGRTYWRKPDSGHLYPRRAALYVEDRREGGGS